MRKREELGRVWMKGREGKRMEREKGEHWKNKRGK